MSENFKNWIKETKKLHHEPAVLAVLEEMEAEISKESRITGTLLTVCLCGGGEICAKGGKDE
jgi:hypothetical protein